MMLAADAGPVSPLSDMEKQICEAWKKVLFRDNIGIRDNFFDVGGNSLKAVELASLLSGLTGWQTDAIDIFKYPTINALALFMDTREDRGRPSISETVAYN
jgi:acyl carrier protein